MVSAPSQTLNIHKDHREGSLFKNIVIVLYIQHFGFEGTFPEKGDIPVH